MRQCAKRLPHTKRNWRLVTHLREDGLLSDSESEEESGVVEESEDSETEEELSFLETDGETEVSETESESSESEEDTDWYGLVET